MSTVQADSGDEKIEPGGAQPSTSSGQDSASKDATTKNGPSKEELRQGFAQMRKLEWITLFYQIGAVVLLAFLVGGSQAMKTEWLENALAIIPVASVLMTLGTENKHADNKHPFGYHRTGTLAFLAAAFTLAAVGTYLFYDSLMKLVHQEHPAIGGITVFGHTIWLGWLMMAAMILTGIPPVILGKLKTPIGKLLHDKALFADADMNRANWMTNGAGFIGLLLVAWGFWWGDTVAALIISLDIMHDGWTNVHKSLEDVMDRPPMDLETGQQQEIVTEVHRVLRALPFVADEKTLLREHGRYIFGEIFIQPNEKLPPTTEAARQVRDAILPLNWRLQHIIVEFTDDLTNDSAVLTREEMEIEDS